MQVYEHASYSTLFHLESCAIVRMYARVRPSAHERTSDQLIVLSPSRFLSLRNAIAVVVRWHRAAHCDDELLGRSYTENARLKETQLQQQHSDSAAPWKQASVLCFSSQRRRRSRPKTNESDGQTDAQTDAHTFAQRRGRAFAL